MRTTTRSFTRLATGLLFCAVLAGAGCGESSENDFDSTQGGDAGNGATAGTSAGSGDAAGEAGQGGSVSTGGVAGSNAGAPSGGSEPAGGQATGGQAGSTGGNVSGGTSGSASGGTAGRDENGGSGGSSAGTGGRSPCGTVQCADDQVCVRPCCSPMMPPCFASPMGTCPEGTRPVPFCPGSMGQGCQTNPCAAPAPYCEDVPDDCDMDLTCGCLGSLCTTGSCSQVASGIVQCVCP
jgi:hypothetical protein